MSKDFKAELIELLNKHSKENDSDTPDYLLSNFIIKCLNAFDTTIIDREKWYGRKRKVSTTDCLKTL